MAEPKKKLSKTRTHRRRAEYKISAPKTSVCSNCNQPILPHMVCPHCGFYKGKSVKAQLPTQRIVLDSSSESK